MQERFDASVGAAGARATQDPNPTLHLPAHIRWCEEDGAVYILDAEQGRYSLMEGSGAAFWTGIVAGEQPSRTVGRIIAEYDADGETVRGDYAAFRDSCLARGFLSQEPASVPAQPAQRRSSPRTNFPAVHAWCAIVHAAFSLKRGGFRGVWRVLQRASAAPTQNPATPIRLEVAEEAFLLAENFYVLHDAPRDCLPRSAALFLFLRRLGFPAVHCIGVERYPASMHAWVTVDDEIVLNDPLAPHMTVIATTGA